VNTKNAQIRMAKDGWTALAVDGLPSAHFEHTLLVDEGRPEILTIPEGYDQAEDFFMAKLAEVA
jgi:methionyl aminopeptidase